MLTRQLVLLSVGAVHYVVVRAITEALMPYVCIIKKFDACGTIHQTPMYRLLEFVFGAKGGCNPLVHG